MNKNLFPNIDQLDMQIMRELELDALITFKDIASNLNVSRTTVTNRVNSLLNRGIFRIVCLADPQVMGYKIIVYLFIQAYPGRIAEVAKKLEACPHIFHIYLCTGHFNITAFAFFRNNEDFSDFLLTDLESVNGIKEVEPITMLQEIKMSYRFLTNDNVPQRPERPLRDLDKMELALIAELQTNGRQKAGHLAEKLGVYRTTVFRRMKRLVDEGVVQIRTIVHPFALGYDGVATIGLKCNPDKVSDAAAKIASYQQVQYVSICAGRYDLIAWVVFRKLTDLRKFVTVDLSSIAGLKDAEILINHKHVKSVDRLPV